MALIENKVLISLQSKNSLLQYEGCASSNEEITNQKFYYCALKDDPEYTICEFCKKKCHGDHDNESIHRLINQKGNYKCHCALDEHKKFFQANNCFYQKICEFLPNIGYFKIDDLNYCPICVQCCVSPKIKNKKRLNKDEILQMKLKNIDLCQCNKHIMGNAHLLQNDIFHHKKLTAAIRNFNFNIFKKDSLLKKICIDYLIDNIIKCNNEKSDKTRLKFLGNTNIQDILHLFYVFSMHFRNKYFFFIPSLIQFENKKLKDEIFKEELNLLNIISPPGSQNKYMKLKVQMYLSNFLFSEYIKKYHIENFNKWNIHTIQNMNIYQRFDNIINVKSKIDEKEIENHKNIIYAILDIYERLLKEHSSDWILIKDIKSEILPVFCRNIKYVIKYHLYSNEEDDSFYLEVTKKFFDLISKTIDILRENRKKEEYENEEKEKNEKEKKERKIIKNSYMNLQDDKIITSFKQSSFPNKQIKIKEEEIEEIENNFSLRSFNNLNKETEELIKDEKQDNFDFTNMSPSIILKAIFYHLLYTNDKCVKKILDKNNKYYEFIFNNPPDEITNIKNIFFSIFNEFPLIEEKYKESYDELIKIIFSFMLQKEDNFYYLQFKNLKIYQEGKKKYEQLKINQNHKDYIDSIIKELRDYARKYFIYEYSYEEYCKNVEITLESFRVFILNNFKLEDLGCQYICFIEKTNQVTMKKIKEFQNLIKQSNLFIALEEIIHIVGQASNFLNREFSENMNLKPSIKLRRFLLKFLYLLMYKDYENTTLILNFNGNSFALFFDFAQKEFFDFLHRITEMYSSTKYYFANMQFLIKVIKGLKLSISKFTGDTFLSLMGDYIGAIDQILKYIKNNKNLLFSFIDLIKNGLDIDTKTKKLSKIIKEYLSEPNREKYSDGYSKETVEKLVINYIKFAGNVLDTDISKYIINLNSIDYISYSLLEKNFISKIEKNEIDFNPRFILPVIRYTLLKKKPFYLNFIMIKEYMTHILTTPIDNINKNFKSKYYEFFVTINKYPYEEIDEENYNFLIKQKYENVMNFLKFINCILINFKSYMELFITQANILFNSYLELKIYLFRFFELLIKNLFYGIKSLEVYLQFIEGKRYKLLFEIIHHILYVTELFYLNINKIEDIMTQDINYIEYRNFENSEIFSKIERFIIDLKPNNENLIVKLRKLASKISGLDYYEVSTYCKYFESILELIIPNFEIQQQEELINDTLIDKIALNYKKALNGENEFINFDDDSVGINVILECDIFKIFDNEKISSIHLEKIPYLRFLINIFSHFSDLNYKKTKVEKDKIINKITGYLKNYINPFLLLMCFSVLCENVKLFELPKYLYKFNLHCEINVLITNFFQILCEGNMIGMKKFLFEQILNVKDDINDKKNVEKYYKLQLSNNMEEIYPKIEPEEPTQIEIKLLKKKSKVIKNNEFRKKKTNKLKYAETLQDENINIDQLKYKLFNILSQNMVFLIKNYKINDKNSLLPFIYQKTNPYIYRNIIKMFQGYKNLLIEMIQGYDFTEDIFSLSTFESLKGIDSQFYFLCQQFSIFPKDIFNPLTEEILYNFIEIVLTILQQDFYFDFNKMNFLQKFISIKELLTLPGRLISDIHWRYILGYNREEKTQSKYFRYLYSEKDLRNLCNEYKKNLNIKEDIYLKMGSLIFLILHILKDKYKIPDIIEQFSMINDTFDNAINYGQELINYAFPKSHYFLGGEIKQSKVILNSFSKFSRKTILQHSKIKPNIDVIKSLKSLRTNSKIIHNFINSIEEKKIEEKKEEKQIDDDSQKKKILFQKVKRMRMLGMKFYNKILKPIEIGRIIPKEENEDGETKFFNKTIYYQEIPQTYMINKEILKAFNNKAKRDTRTDKLNSLLDYVNELKKIVSYQTNHFINPKYKFLYHFNYEYIDKFNCVLCVILNLIFLFALTNDIAHQRLLSKITNIIEFILLLINFFFLSIFLIFKYPLYVYLNKEKYKEELKTKEKKNFFYYWNIYIWNSFLYNEETYLMLLVSLIALISLFTELDIIIISIQLLIIAKFIDTIQDILSAFIQKLDQLLSLIFFLAILMFFFANLDFYFFKNEYQITEENGTTLEVCSSLLECYITLFNNGVRAAGGIADVLPEVEFYSLRFYSRYCHDMLFFIFVILILINMINGVIVTAFGQLREDANERENDIENVCFICNAHRDEVELGKEHFNDHVMRHNVKLYLRYLIALLMMEQSDMDQDQYYINDCINSDSIDFFPRYNNE